MKSERSGAFGSAVITAEVRYSLVTKYYCRPGSIQNKGFRGPESPRRSRLPGLAVVRKSEIFVITEDRRSSERRASVALLPVVLASPGEHRSPELAAHSAANVRVRRERLALLVRQDSVGCPAETDRLARAYLNTTAGPAERSSTGTGPVRGVPREEPDRDSVERRVAAVERALSAEEPIERSDRLDDLEDRVAELEAAVEAVRGYVGEVRAINEDVERRADRALRKARALERHVGPEETDAELAETDGETTETEAGVAARLRRWR